MTFVTRAMARNLGGTEVTFVCEGLKAVMLMVSGLKTMADVDGDAEAAATFADLREDLIMLHTAHEEVK